MWFAKVVVNWCDGRAEMIRYADDVVFCFEDERDARGFFNALKARLKKFNLELSEEKSQIIKFGRDAGDDAGKFDFLGFTHTTGKCRSGKFKVMRKSSKKKLKAKRAIAKKWIWENMHMPVKTLVDKLNQKLRGHYNYYGITGNYAAMYDFREYNLDRLEAVLRRRGAKKVMSNEAFRKLIVKYPVILPRIVHRV
jgi:hypothetical protein